MGIDLALILGIMGTIWTGSPLSIVPKFSIGGTVAADGSDNIFENLFGLLGMKMMSQAPTTCHTYIQTGNPRGLRGSHNWIESDSSLTRDDLYVTADAWSMNMTLFRDIHDRADRNGVISIGLLAEQAARRWHFSVSHNPHFYYGPVTGMVSRNAGYLFLGRLLSNHTYEHPDGVLTQEVFRKFFAVYENSEGNLAYRKGHETIPKNWYRTKREYGLVLLNADIVSWVLKHPELGRYVVQYSLLCKKGTSLTHFPSIGGNTGTVNSFAAVDLHNITGGVLNSTLLLENNNFLCFVFELLKTFLPNSLSPLFSTIEGPLNLITNVLSASMRSLECPAWKDITQGEKPLWDTIQHSFTGASEAGSSL
jgi:hypothetical protein